MRVSLTFLCIGSAGLVACATLDRGVRRYERADYAAAADDFCVVSSTASGVVQQEAQYGFASSLEQTGFPLAAIHVRFAIMDAGSAHAFFKAAVTELGHEGVKRFDGKLIARRLDPPYNKANQRALAAMDPRGLQSVHYLLGMYCARRGNLTDARAFLQSIKQGHPSYDRAQELLAGDNARLKALAAEEAARSATAWRAELDVEQATFLTSPPSSSCVVDAISGAHASLSAALK